MEERKYTLQQAAQMAIDVQNACNLSGIVRDLPAIMSTIWEQARREEKGTDWVNTHPIALMFISKLCDLSRYGYGDQVDNFGKAYDVCKRLAAGEAA